MAVNEVLNGVLRTAKLLLMVWSSHNDEHELYFPRICNMEAFSVFPSLQLCEQLNALWPCEYSYSSNVLWIFFCSEFPFPWFFSTSFCSLRIEYSYSFRCGGHWVGWSFLRRRISAMGMELIFRHAREAEAWQGRQ